MVRIWENHLKPAPAPKSLPLILPVVLAQNAEVWTIPTRFSELLDLPAGHAADLQPFLPDFTFRIIQLANLPFDSIRGTPTGIMTLRVMKAERLAELLSDPVWDEVLLGQLPRETLEFLIRYILRADTDRSVFDRKVAEITNPELKNTAMSLAQQLEQKGRQEGLEKGLRQTLLKILQRRSGQIPGGLVEAIDGIHDPAKLEGLVDAALDAQSLEVFTLAL